MQNKFITDLEKRGWTAEEVAKLLDVLRAYLIDSVHQDGNKKTKVADLLIGWGFTPSHKGFLYLIDAAIYVAEKDSSVSLRNELYPVIGEMHHVTNQNVERAIRFSIKTAYENNQKLLEILPPPSKKNMTTNSRFIAFVAYQIKHFL